METRTKSRSSVCCTAYTKGRGGTSGDLSEQFSHVDYVTDIGKIDVKARKRVSRTDEDVQDELVWLEFKNVQGKQGWIYGKADIIAFEREEDFLLVKRDDLAKLGEDLCDLDDRVTKGYEALQRLPKKGKKRSTFHH